MIASKKSILSALITPSILNADLANLGFECEKLIKAGADWLHLDIMDNQFVPNLTFGPPLVKSLRKKLPLAFLDCHCMVQNPEKIIDDLASAGANQITFHYEAAKYNTIEILTKIKEKNMLAGLSIKPKTNLDENIFELINKNLIDNFLIMTVEPGFGGQKFMEDMMPKVKTLREKYPQLNIQVDGGIKCENINIAAKAGANVIVSGTGIIDHFDQQYAIMFMRETVKKYMEMTPEEIAEEEDAQNHEK